MAVRKILVAGLVALGAAGMAFAGQGGGPEDEGHKHRHMHMRHASIQRMAMQNILSELLSTKTGRPVAEITALLDESHPHEAMEQLGLDEAEMRPLFEQAHATLLSKATAAGLITAEQAEELRSMPRLKRKGPRPAEDAQ